MLSSIRAINFETAEKRPLLRVAVMVYLLVASFYTVFRYLLEIADGGQVWTTGDWLISYRAGFVRRGLTGSLTYNITDLTGVDALYVAAAMQIVVYAGLTVAVLVMLSRIKMTIPVAILAMSPVFLLMPFFILKLAMTKEMIGFLAIALVAMTAFTARKWPLWAGVVVYATAGFAHEINAFMAPDLLALLFVLAVAKVIPHRQAWFAAILVVMSAAAAVLSSMIYNGNGMGDAICKVMLSYGGRAEFCGNSGPTIWLDRDMAYGMMFTWTENVLSGVWPWFILGFILSMAPFLLFRVADDASGGKTRLALLAAFIGILAYAPLFVIASDWGRWIAMHVFCLTMLTYAGLRLGLITERFAKLSPVFLIFVFVWAMPDFGEPLTPGMLQKAMSLVSHAQRFLTG